MSYPPVRSFPNAPDLTSELFAIIKSDLRCEVSLRREL